MHRYLQGPFRYSDWGSPCWSPWEFQKNPTISVFWWIAMKVKFPSGCIPKSFAIPPIFLSYHHDNFLVFCEVGQQTSEIFLYFLDIRGPLSGEHFGDASADQSFHLHKKIKTWIKNSLAQHLLQKFMVPRWWIVFEDSVTYTPLPWVKLGFVWRLKH